MSGNDPLFQLLIRLADDHLILGHRLSEWCGHAPILEEDLSMPNMALDLIGQARNLYDYAGRVEAEGRDEDALAYLRKESEYRNLLIAELPNGDFGHTMLRQFYFSVFMELFWTHTVESSDETLASIAAKAVKEVAYHVRHTAEWVIRLGDGTPESHKRMTAAVEELHRYTSEMFECDGVVNAMVEAGVIPDLKSLLPDWEKQVGQVFKAASLDIPSDFWPRTGGRNGEHSEAMGYLLADLQYMQRTYPGMTW